jgi:hypothetical protein
VTDPKSVLNELIELATYYAGRPAEPESRPYEDLDINGGDFIEFVEEAERRYCVDLSWVSPTEATAKAQDPTLKELSNDVVRQRSSKQASGESHPNRS